MCIAFTLELLLLRDLSSLDRVPNRRSSDVLKCRLLAILGLSGFQVDFNLLDDVPNASICVVDLVEVVVVFRIAGVLGLGTVIAADEVGLVDDTLANDVGVVADNDEEDGNGVHAVGADTDEVVGVQNDNFAVCKKVHNSTF